MKNISWLMVLGSIVVLALAPACGSDDSSGSGGSGGSSGAAGSGTGGAAGSGTGGAAGSGTGGAAGGSSHQACVDAAAKVKAVATSLGCTDSSGSVQGLCETLYAAGQCTAEFEAVLACVSPKPDSDWECTADGPDYKAGVCQTESDAFDACTTP